MYELLSFYPGVGYFLLFILMPIGGTIPLLIAAFLAQRGLLHWKTIILVATLGEIVGDSLWYLLGAFIGKYFLNGQNNFLARKMRLAKKFFDKYHLWAIFLSKFIYGFAQPTLIFTGATSQKFKRVFVTIVFASFVYSVTITSLGYFFSLSISSVHHFLLELALLIVIVILIILVSKFIVRRYLTNYFNNKNNKVLEKHPDR